MQSQKGVKHCLLDDFVQLEPGDLRANKLHSKLDLTEASQQFAIHTDCWHEVGIHRSIKYQLSNFGLDID